MGIVGVGGIFALLGVPRSTRQKLCLLQSLDIRVVHATGAAGQIFDGVEVELGTLALGLGPKRLGKRLRVDGNLGSMLFQAIDVALFLNQAHGQLVALH